MRLLLSFLLSFVLLEAQTMAQSHIGPNGGPNYGSLGTITGVYAGVLVPTSAISGTQPEQVTDANGITTTIYVPIANALGLFTLSVPTTGPGTGSFIIFMGNRVLNGSINAIADPSSQTIQGLLSATFNYSEFFLVNTGSGQTVDTESVTSTASGTLDATVGQSTSGLSSSLQTLTGTAVLQVDQGHITNNGTPIVTQGPIDFAVEGNQQSTTAGSAGSFSAG